MKLLKITAALIIVLALCFGFGTFLLQGGIRILDAGELTYARKGQSAVTVSPISHPFSYYYQVAFFGTGAGFLLLLGVAVCMYGLAKIIRSADSQQNQIAARIHSTATYIAWFAVSLFAAWLILRLLRGALIT